MLDFMGLIITTALMVLVVNTLTIFIDASRAAKVTLAAAIGSGLALPPRRRRLDGSRSQGRFQSWDFSWRCRFSRRD